MVPGGWKLHKGIHTRPYTLSYDPDCSVVRDPDPQWLLPFPSLEEGKHAAMYVCFSIFPSSLLFFSKESQPLALTLSLSSLLSLSLVGMEADGSWHDGGIVLTVELMWPRGCCPCMLGLMAQNVKRDHRGKRVGVAERGEKEMRRIQLCMEVDREMQHSRGVFTRRTGRNLLKKCTKSHLRGLEMTWTVLHWFMITL